MAATVCPGDRLGRQVRLEVRAARTKPPLAVPSVCSLGPLLPPAPVHSDAIASLCALRAGRVRAGPRHARAERRHLRIHPRHAAHSPRRPRRGLAGRSAWHRCATTAEHPRGTPAYPPAVGKLQLALQGRPQDTSGQHRSRCRLLASLSQGSTRHIVEVVPAGNVSRVPQPGDLVTVKVREQRTQAKQSTQSGA